MDRHSARLRRRQLDRQLKNLDQRIPPRPLDGWIRAIRESLGMSIRQLAERLQVSTASAAETERREADATITLKSLSRAAAAMDCRLVYALIPEDSLDAIVRRQAEQVAEQVLSRVETTMALEDQSTDPAARRQQRQELVDELVRTTPRDLWDVR